ncbi:FAD-dependent oxidoreductase [Algiphilus sp. W345]|uniref:FAD-dependent oxidoreductase n=1 Tax=Banduia mediterranea TaxID=3075609 RepID=A0ABU2WII2_9GAMM|nr:FAD-dependent oxidoreductase [Algiphilus sp. W345]MDT0497675.1 FAD-dependent oxidoreductase [Algiphilus sp. W345]
MSRRHFAEQADLNETNHPHVVIVGAGFGGLSTARALAKAPVDITIVDRRNSTCSSPCRTR